MKRSAGNYFDRIARALAGRFAWMPGRRRAKLLDHGKRTLLVDAQRRLNMYLRAMWGCEFVIQPTSRHYENRAGYKPFLENRAIHLPNLYADCALTGAVVPSLEIYRAASAHAAAHVIYGSNFITDKALRKWQQAVISVIEDARVETLAIRQFPGLKPLWAGQHGATRADAATAGDYLNRLARALLDDSYLDDDPWIARGRELFAAADLQNDRIALPIGIELAQRFKSKNLRFRNRRDLQSAPYRDDNQHLWEAPKPESAKKARLRRKSKRVIVAYRFANFFGITKEAAAAGEEAREITEHSFVQVRETSGLASELKARDLLSAPYHYPEWDYKEQAERPSWVTLREMKSRSGDVALIDRIIAEHRHVIARMKTLLDAIKDDVKRVRKQEEGDEIDVAAAIRARIDLKMGIQPDLRIMMSSVRKSRNISVLVLLDMSKSTNNRVQGQRHTVLQMIRQACVLLADAIEKLGDPFAIHGFHSDGRHDVQYFRFKDFDQPYDDIAKARIAGMTGQESTRMGAAIRHAAHCLDAQNSKVKLLMVLTDGEPSDVDVADRQYLHLDTKMAVEAASRVGVKTYCITVDPSADQYVSRIFGARNYMVVDHVNSLPEKLVRLYAGLSR